MYDGLPIVYDAKDIENSILTIYGTRIMSRPMNREFGSLVEDLLWLPMLDTTVERIKEEMFDSVRRWETRVLMKTIQIIPDYTNGAYYVKMTYDVPSLALSNIQLVFNLNRRNS